MAQRQIEEERRHRDARDGDHEAAVHAEFAAGESGGERGGALCERFGEGDQKGAGGESAAADVEEGNGGESEELTGSGGDLNFKDGDEAVLFFVLAERVQNKKGEKFSGKSFQEFGESESGKLFALSGSFIWKRL